MVKTAVPAYVGGLSPKPYAKSFACPLCSNVFRQRRNRDTHVRTVHSAAVSRPAVVMMDSPFAFDFGKIFDGIKSGIDDMTKGMAGNKGDAGDIDEYW